MVNHEILLRKLLRHVIRGIPLSLFTSYLGNRTQRVTVGFSLSSARAIYCGVPQGSVLGPLLFLLYINDLEQIGNAHLTLFADDTTIACSYMDHIRLISDANEVLSSINEWTISNKLGLKVSKLLIF